MQANKGNWFENASVLMEISTQNLEISLKFELFRFRNDQGNPIKISDMHIHPVGFFYYLRSDDLFSTGGEHLPILQYYELI